MGLTPADQRLVPFLNVYRDPLDFTNLGVSQDPPSL